MFPQIYLRLRHHVSVESQSKIRLEQVADIFTEGIAKEKLAQLVLCAPNIEDGNRILIDMIHIVQVIKHAFPNMIIKSYGKPHVLVHVDVKERRSHVIWFIGVWILLFFGSGLAIMNFHADVSMLDVQQHVYEMITGEKADHPLFFQIPYSIGVGIGMIVFFNHFFKKKMNEEPTPLEVEMFLYQENLNQYVVAEEYQRHKEQGHNEC